MGHSKAFRKDPERHPLKTPSGKFELFSHHVHGFGYDDCPGFAKWIEPAEWLGSKLAERYPIHLLSNKAATRLHSQLDYATVSQRSKIEGLEPILINPVDAKRRGLKTGMRVKVFNERGATHAATLVPDDVMPGVAILSSGA
ncbi:molybdopterin dinucleotide binding domain-containing protein [Tropicimonas sp. IMCC6043]|uniref:molybdopterin dinucleotide binding domain-containing protein n=1 Tax=Tropicimonas sp. IMCC6043 TaxID=2510645 RepID=UPI00101B64A1|nr:molybdopterin dinucleotide binding domain-containing protein [Tropicimonas sp. IMCC6043]RYH07645.1 hypothetical protein EU800_19235 [Tropicimonas sp. IMCC6043]